MLKKKKKKESAKLNLTLCTRVSPSTFLLFHLLNAQYNYSPLVTSIAKDYIKSYYKNQQLREDLEKKREIECFQCRA